MLYLQELETLKHIIREGRGFQGRSDQKMRNVARTRNCCGHGLPPLRNPREGL